MLTINTIRTFIRENTTSCRVFWGVMYNVYFLLGWVSFYCTKICNNMKLFEYGEKPKTVSLSVHIALGLVALVVSMYKFLAMLIFPYCCVFMGSVLGDAPSLWMWIGVVGCFYSILIGYIDADDYGIEAFMGMCLGLLLKLNDKTGKFILIVAFTAANQISREMEAREKDK